MNLWTTKLRQERKNLLAKKWYEENLEQAKETRKKWRVANVVKMKAYQRSYYERNKELVKERAILWRKANPDAVRLIHRKNYARSPEKHTFYHKQRLRFKMGNGGSHTLEEWENLKVRFNFMCAACKKAVELTEDHILPLSLGGSDDINNIQPLCRSCNSRKGNSYAIPRSK